MYRLFHIPTGTYLVETDRMIDVWRYLNQNPNWERKDCVVYRYELVERLDLAEKENV